MPAPRSGICCLTPPAEATRAVPACSYEHGHDGPHEWDADAAAPVSRAHLQPKSMRDVIDLLEQLYGPDDAALALAYGKVPGGKYPGMTAAEVCCTAEGRYDYWTATKAMADGLFA